MKITLPEDVKNIISTLQEAGYEAYAVGGCVRDSILGNEPADWDITTSAVPFDVKKLFRRTVDTGLKHGTVTVLMDKTGYEVTTYRIDGEYEDGRHPKEVTFTRELKEDLRRRDFTINAMAYNDDTGVVDLFGGMEDLEKKVIRCVGEPKERFSEDALRMLRAIRFAARLDFTIEEKTLDAIKDLAPTLSKVSAERIQAELNKLLISGRPDDLRVAWETGLTSVFFPEFDLCMNTPQNNPHHCYNVGEHLLHSMKEAPDTLTIRLAMMLHDICKPQCRTTDEKGVDHFHGHAAKSRDAARTILRRLKYDNDTIYTVCKLVEFHDYHIATSDMDDDPEGIEISIRKLLHKLGPELFPDLTEVMRADVLAQSLYEREEKLDDLRNMQAHYEKIMERGDCLGLKELAVTGQDLIRAGMKPGRQMGETLNAMLKEVLEHPSMNDKAALFQRFHIHAAKVLILGVLPLLLAMSMLLTACGSMNGPSGGEAGSGTDTVTESEAIAGSETDIATESQATAESSTDETVNPAGSGEGSQTDANGSTADKQDATAGESGEAENKKAETKENTVAATYSVKSYPPGTYDSADTAVILEVNVKKSYISLMNRKAGKEYTLTYDGTTCFFDPSGLAMSAAQLKAGLIVDVTFIKEARRLNTLQISQSAWELVNPETFDIQPGAIVIGKDSYSYSDQTVFLDEKGKKTTALNIDLVDQLTFRGIDNTVYAVCVNKGHGYLSLKNDEYFIGGWIEVGSSLIQKITKDMVVAVPEGTHTVSITNGDIGGTKQILIRSGESLELDIGDLKGEETVSGTVIFTVEPSEASLYIDGSKVDYSLPISLEYGIHQMIARCSGYVTITQYIRVDQPSVGISVELEEELVDDTDQTGSEEKPDVSSNDKPVSGNDAQTTDFKVTVDAPTGAEVYVDGNYIGIAPVSFKKVAGSHVITLRQTGYVSRNYTIQIDSEAKDVNYSFPAMSTVSSND
ncbi:MAG: CCA tRNA nucleotidyltransferase [Lachnospiraceae bacterium]|nr:CCA tRNA nucleotidyltransferase [Lachnospiraceae bacterium]